MKAALVVFFAVVAVASASVLPLGLGHGIGVAGLGVPGIGLSGLGLAGVGAWGAPWGGPWGAGIIQHAPAAVTVAENPISLQSLHAPVAIAAHAPVVAAAHAPIVAAAHAPHGAVSVNANRGSVHVAPLPGHIASSSQLNLAPAPGTW